jgi:hypothetical protein
MRRRLSIFSERLSKIENDDSLELIVLRAGGRASPQESHMKSAVALFNEPAASAALQDNFFAPAQRLEKSSRLMLIFERDIVLRYQTTHPMSGKDWRRWEQSASQTSGIN